MTSFSSIFLPSVKNKTVGQAWSEFKNTIHEGIDKFIPSKFIGSNKHLPRINNSIKRDIRRIICIRNLKSLDQLRVRKSL